MSDYKYQKKYWPKKKKNLHKKLKQVTKNGEKFEIHKNVDSFQYNKNDSKLMSILHVLYLLRCIVSGDSNKNT